MYTYGLVSISFRSHSPKAIVEAVKAAGLSCIEWGSDVHAPCDDLGRLQEIAALCRREGIAVCSYGTYFKLGETPLAELPAYIRAASVLGTDILRLWCGSKGYADYTPAEWESLMDQCRQAAKMAESAGVTLCMECHGGTVTDCIEGALRLMREVDSPAFRMYWQPNQYRTVAENVDYARQIAPFARHLHVFNWEGDTKLPLADAAALWQDYLKEFSGDRCLLLEFMPDDRLDSLSREAAALKAIGGNDL